MTAEVYRLISSPTLPAIPLLTACGYVLAEGHASPRLLRFFKALFGWMPGGLAVMVTACARSSPPSPAARAITMIAVGGLVLPMLLQDGYPEDFSLGLVTASGSLGLLFPPSLPVDPLRVVAGTREHNVPADLLFLARPAAGHAHRPDGRGLLGAQGPAARRSRASVRAARGRDGHLGGQVGDARSPSSWWGCS